MNPNMNRVSPKKKPINMLIYSKPRISLQNFVASNDWRKNIEYNFAGVNGWRKDVKDLKI